MSTARAPLPPQARVPVFAAMLAVAVVLTATSSRYGYHRDELYFRLLKPGWGYVDQSPLTPLLARLFGAVADEPWAIRIPATAATVVTIYVVALITREAGGGRDAQALCAWAFGFASVPLVLGHALLTSTVDEPVWPLVALFVIRAQLRGRPQWWLAAGLVVGASMYNKLLVALLLVALAAGLALVGPRRVLWSRWVLAAAGLALVVGAPNLIYQATHGWPEIGMGRALADHNAGGVRVSMWPFLFLILGPPLVPVWVAGMVGLVRRPAWREVRFLAAAFPILLVLVFLMGTQNYYPAGLVAVLFAFGCVPTVEWISRSAGGRRAVVASAVAVNSAVSIVIGLPVIPLSALGGTPVPAINQIVADSVGWPRYVAQIAGVYATVATEDRARTVIVASNYGEAGAVDRYGSRYGLPTVYSGQNQLYFQARPPASATVAVVVGGQVDLAGTLFAQCVTGGRLDNGLDVDNEEQGEPIAVCRGPIGGWAAAWPQLRHQD